MESFWVQVSEASLKQGDHLPGCLIPTVGPDFTATGNHEVMAGQSDLIIVTQSCDLEQRRVRLVAGCPIYALTEFEAVNPAFAKRGRWNEVLKGRVEGLHLLASPLDPSKSRAALVVDFREIFSLPIDYLENRAIELGPRWRLRPPYLEHFSQAFARFFMRVGLPSSIPPIP